MRFGMAGQPPLFPTLRVRVRDFAHEAGRPPGNNLKAFRHRYLELSDPYLNSCLQKLMIVIAHHISPLLFVSAVLSTPQEPPSFELVIVNHISTIHCSTQHCVRIQFTKAKRFAMIGQEASDGRSCWRGSCQKRARTTDKGTHCPWPSKAVQSMLIDTDIHD